MMRRIANREKSLAKANEELKAMEVLLDDCESLRRSQQEEAREEINRIRDQLLAAHQNAQRFTLTYNLA